MTSVTKMEFIGTAVEVVGENPYRGIRGTIVDETRNTVRIESPTGEKIVPKSGALFKIAFPDGTISTIEGRAIAHRPEDRIKKA